VKDDLARGVEAARAVVLHFARHPAGDVALPDLPLERWTFRVHARTTRDFHLHVHGDDVIAVIVFQSDVKRVSGRGRRAEHREAIARQFQLPQVVTHPASVAARERAEDSRGADGEAAFGAEDDRFAVLGADRGNLGAFGDEHVVFLRGGKVKRHRRLRCPGWLEASADQLQQSDENLVRHAIDAKQDHLRHPREEFDHRHAGIGHVVIRPLGRVPRNQPLGLIHDVLKFAVVQIQIR
jgi:hypothetical protein